MSVLEVKGFKKVNEFLDPEILTAQDLTRLENMVLDSQGLKAVKRGGFSFFNSNNIGNSIYKMFDIAVGGSNLLLAYTGSALYKSVNGAGAWSLVKATASGTECRMSAYNGKFYFSGSSLFATDGTNNWSVGIAAPWLYTLTSEKVPIGGNLQNLTPNAKYKWCLVYITDVGEMSYPSTAFTYYINATDNNSTDNSYQAIQFKNLPVSTDSRVVGRLIYRTKADGEVFYLLTRLDNTTTSFLDWYPDTKLDLSQQLELPGIPSTAKYSCVHKERLLLANLSYSNTVTQPTWMKAGINGYEFHADLNSAVGSMTTGATYGYKVVWIDKSGLISNSYSCSIILTGGATSVDVRNIPTPPNANIECRLYRTAANGATYYFLTTSNNATFFDDKADGSLGSEVLPGPSGSTSTYSCGVMFSEIGKPNQMNLYNPNNPTASFLIQVYPDDSDEITGIVDYDQSVIVFKKNSISRIITSGDPQGWVLQRLQDNIGCDQPESIVKAGSKLYFMNNKKLYRANSPDSIPTIDALPNIISNDYVNTFKSITSVNGACYSSSNNWYVLLATIGSNRTVLVFDEKLETWYKFLPDATNPLSWQSCIEKVYGTDKGALLFGHLTIGQVSKYDTSVSVDTYSALILTEIQCLLQTKTFTVSDPNVLIRLRRMLANYKKKAGIANPTHYIYSLDDGLYRQITDTAAVADGYVTNILVTDAMTGGSAPNNTLMITNKFYYQIYGTGLTEFNGLNIDYRLINRGRRAV